MENKKKVIVLLSTYNGASFLREMLDSIIGQSYENIEIVVRDDGSKDGTQDILKEYESKNLIHVIYGENVGMNRSFFGLLKDAEGADYYSFAEQDDIWFPENVARAVEHLENEDNHIPQLYTGAFDFYDSEMKYIAKGPRYTHPKSLVRTLVLSQIYLGFTMVINEEMKKLIDESDTLNLNMSCYHDYWLSLLGLSLGNIVYDPVATVKYRRHENNVSTFKNNFWAIQKGRFQRFLFGNELKAYCESNEYFYELYKDKMGEENRKSFELFIKKRYNFKKAIKKCFFPERYRDSLFDEIGLRLLFLIGKM